MNRKVIFICSPYRGDVEKNKAIAHKICKDAIAKGHIPIAPHLYLTQFLDDDVPEQRKTGMDMALDLLEVCDELWAYNTLKPSEGMAREILKAGQLGLPIRDVKDIQIMEDVCVACGKNYVPEGRVVCHVCEGKIK